MDPTPTGTVGVRHYAVLVLGKRAWYAPCTNGDYLPVPLTGLPDLIKVVGPFAVQAVVCRLAHTVTRVYCCVQASGAVCYKANSKGVAMVFITTPTPFLLEMSGVGRC